MAGTEMDPVLQAMRMQFEAQAAFRAQAGIDNASGQDSAPSNRGGHGGGHSGGQRAQNNKAMMAQAHQQGDWMQQQPHGTHSGGHMGHMHQQQLDGQHGEKGHRQKGSGKGRGRYGDVQATMQEEPKAPSPAQEAAARIAEQMKRIKEEKAKREEEEKAEIDRLRCHLHKKPKDSCRFCKKWQDAVNKGREGKASLKAPGPGEASQKALGAGEDASTGLLELLNTKTFGLPPLLQSHITESQHFKSLMSVEFDQVVDEIYQFADGVEPYMQNSTTTPSALFCCFYRFLTMGLSGQQLKRLINGTENPFVRCVGFLFIRFGLDPGRLWSWLGEYVLDEEEFKPTKDSEYVTTIGEYVEALLSQDRYYSTVLPRLPMSTKRQLEAKLAQVPQWRKRTQANTRLLDVYRMRDIRVEVAPDDAEWVSGTIVHLDESVQTRPKVRVRLDDGGEAIIHIGKVILADPRYSANNGYYRPRQRSRSRSPQVDWARCKGKSQAELVDEQRSREREKAVCSSGKEYARKPVGFKVACALPREMGAASHRLMEDETFVPMRRESRRQGPSPSREEQPKKVQHSAEHQAQMQQLFEKYGMQKSLEVSSASSNNLMDSQAPDVMRLG